MDHISYKKAKLSNKFFREALQGTFKIKNNKSIKSKHIKIVGKVAGSFAWSIIRNTIFQI